jgi:putative ABC transport system permease protein
MFISGIVRATIRNFRKHLITSIIKIIGVVISISAVIIIWLYVINENKYDSNVPDGDRIYRMDSFWASMPPYIGHAIMQNLGKDAKVTRLNFWGNVGIQINNNPFNIKEMVFADSTFFEVFQFDLMEGDAKEALFRPFSLVLSESAAKRLFGDEDPLGKIVRFQNQWDFTVTAIMRDRLYLHFKTDFIASIVSLKQIRYADVLTEFDGWSYPTYLFLPHNTTEAEVEKRVRDLMKKVGYENEFHLKPFSDIYYSHEIENESNTKHGNLLYNRILISVSVFILLLAAINFINLTIANAVSRSKEVSIKKLQGASKAGLIFQFLIETILFILISIGLSILLLWFLSPVLSSLTGFSIRITDFFVSHNLLIFAVGIVAFIMISGVYPAFHISSYSINSNQNRVSGYSNHTGIRNALIIFQNLVSISLICSTLIANRQFRYMNKKDLGFNKSGIINLSINSQLAGHLDLLKEKLSQYPEISAISYSSRLPGNYWGSWCCVNIEGHENKYFNNYVDADYLNTMGIKIKEGRNFSAENPADIKATYLINETAIKLYDLKDPVSQVIFPGNGIKGQIIGIIKDFHYRGLNYELSPLLLFYTPEHLNFINIRLDKNNIRSGLEKIKSSWDELCPAFAFEYSILDETYDLQYKSERRFESLLFSFAILAIFIAGIGLLGLSVYSTERRTKEIGIRKINGARVPEVMIMLNRDFLKWVAIAFIIACPVSWYTMQKWLQTFAYKTQLSLWIFILAGLSAFTIALVTVSWQSWRAATRNPVEALRYE